jgi:crossover junction endodeoxyribonuclease RuvC
MEKKKGKIILGVDPGTQVTGFGVIEAFSQKILPIDFGNIYAKDEELHYRYLTIFNRLEELALLHKPDAISVETQFHSKNIQSTMKLSMARAVVMLIAAKYNIAFFEYAPTRVKQAATGLGSASKYQVQKMICSILGIVGTIPPEDAADALALAICHAHSYKALCYV